MKGENARRELGALASLMFVLVMTSATRVQARDGPKKIDMPLPTPTASATVTPSATPTSTQYPTATPTATVIPTPTLNPVTEITAMIKTRRCLYYRGLVEQWILLEPKEFEWLTIDNVALILAIGAAESGCNNKLVSEDGYSSIGIMQVIPRPWTAPVDLLRIPSVNIYWGMWILDRAIAKTNGNVRTALGGYNCGFDKLEQDACGKHGGFAYADQVLNFWLPRIIQAMEE